LQAPKKNEESKRKNQSLQYSRREKEGNDLFQEEIKSVDRKSNKGFLFLPFKIFFFQKQKIRNEQLYPIRICRKLQQMKTTTI
jgi:hypothetical protein